MNEQNLLDISPDEAVTEVKYAVDETLQNLLESTECPQSREHIGFLQLLLSILPSAFVLQAAGNFMNHKAIDIETQMSELAAAQREREQLKSVFHIGSSLIMCRDIGLPERVAFAVTRQQHPTVDPRYISDQTRKAYARRNVVNHPFGNGY